MSSPSNKSPLRTLRYALLGLLARQPLTGYDLTSQLKSRLGPFWSTSYSQVYPALSKLETEGLATHKAVQQHGRPDKKIFSITREGLADLKRWVTSALGPRHAKDELVLRAYCVWVADPQKAAILFREQERLHEQRYAEYETKLQWMKTEWGDDVHKFNSPHFASVAAVRMGIIYERGYADWCRWVAERSEKSARSKPASNPEAAPRKDRLMKKQKSRK